MHPALSRRGFLGGLVAAPLGCKAETRRHRGPAGVLADIEDRIGGRLGVHALATDTGATVSYRQDERFAMCSTFKWALAAAVLIEVDRGRLSLGQNLRYSAADLLEYAPVTRKNVGRSAMTLEELAEASVTVSDNTAANLLLKLVGGPSGFTRFVRDRGDRVTRLDRNEPMLNENVAGDPRDTTSPRAMVTLMRTLLGSQALSPPSRDKLFGWMIASPTGAKRLRAGLPRSWRAGDKTGTGPRGAVSDVAVAWPPKRPPILIAVYTSDSWSLTSTLSAAHAEVGRIVASELGRAR